MAAVKRTSEDASQPHSGAHALQSVALALRVQTAHQAGCANANNLYIATMSLATGTPASVWVLTEGMGDLDDKTVGDVFRAQLQHHFQGGMPYDDHTCQAVLPHVLRALLENAHRAIQAYEAAWGVGASAVGAMIMENQLHVASVGEMHAYLLHSDNAAGGNQITRLIPVRDLVQQLLDLDHERSGDQPLPNLLYRTLGTRPKIVIDTNTAPIQDGDTLVLCSGEVAGCRINAELTPVLHCEHLSQHVRKRFAP